MSSSKLNCLMVLSGSKEGNSAKSFMQSFSLLHSTFNVQLATPGARPLEFVNQDDLIRRNLNEFRMRPIAIPISLETVDPFRYSCLAIPHSPGAAWDLVENEDMGQILKHFVQEKKPICAIGMGVAALFPAMEDGTWLFRNYSFTSISVFELARSSDFEKLSIIPEDTIKERGAIYSCTDPDEIHVVIDRHLVTAQNEQSSLTAVQNLILMCNQKTSNKERNLMFIS